MHAIVVRTASGREMAELADDKALERFRNMIASGASVVYEGGYDGDPKDFDRERFIEEAKQRAVW